jgi:hypothetical protein
MLPAGHVVAGSLLAVADGSAEGVGEGVDDGPAGEAEANGEAEAAGTGGGAATGAAPGTSAAVFCTGEEPPPRRTRNSIRSRTATTTAKTDTLRRQ